MRSFYASFEWAIEAAPSPRNALRVPLAQARVGLVSPASGYERGQRRFSLGDENDASFRAIGWDTAVRFAHGGYDTRRAYRDPEIVLPRETLSVLAAEGVIGGTAERAFALMGYIPDTGPLLEETGPRMASELLADAVDLVLLVPA